MKRFVLIMLSIFTCTIAFAATETINWYVDGNTYATNTCQTGGDIILPTTPTKYGYTFNGWKGYTPIEYLESTGTQWIDTGFIANGGMIIDTKVQPYGTKLHLGSIGKKNVSDPDLTRNEFFYTNGNYMFEKVNKYNYSYAAPNSVPVIIYFDTTNSNLYATVDNNVVVNLHNTNYLSNQPNTVKMAYSDYNSTPSGGRFYYVKIYNNSNVLIRDFIPVLDGNGTPCMFDKVEDKFYYNQGTGQFIAGPIINQ